MSLFSGTTSFSKKDRCAVMWVEGHKRRGFYHGWPPRKKIPRGLASSAAGFGEGGGHVAGSDVGSGAASGILVIVNAMDVREFLFRHAVARIKQ